MVENELALRHRCRESRGRREFAGSHQQIEHETCSRYGLDASTYIGAIEPISVGFVVHFVSYAHEPAAIWSVHHLRDGVGDVGRREIDPANHTRYRGLGL